MNRANKILTSLSLLRASPSLPHHLQACQFSPLLTFSLSPHNSFITQQQKSHFSSTPIPAIVNLLVTNNWSEDLEKQLQENTFHSTPITHETVVYVLKNLEKTPKKAFHFFNWVCNNHGFNPSSLVYNQMLLILSNEETLNEFWGLSKEMSEQGCEIDEKVYPLVLGKFKSMGRMNEVKDWIHYYRYMMEATAKDATVLGLVEVVVRSELVSNDDVIEKLEQFKSDLSESKILMIFHALNEFPLKAFNFFRWLKDHLEYTHNAVTYNAILRVLKQKVSIKEFWSVVEEMKSAGHYLDIDTYIKISRHFRATMMLEDLVELYELMMDSPYKPRNEECAFLLRDISKTETPDIDLVHRVVNKYEASGNALSKAAYDAIYRSYSSMGKFEEAEKTLVTMKNAGFDRDILTYSDGLFALGKAGKLHEAIKMLKEMEKRGCHPDLKTWTNLIRGQCRGGYIDQALECQAMLLQTNLKVDANILDVLVTGLCGKKRVDSAYTLVSDLLNKTTMRPLLSTFEILIQNLLEERELQRAMELLPLVKNCDYPLVKQPFVDYISKFGTVEDAIKWLKALPVSRYPSVTTYGTILQSFLEEGRESEARQLLDKCPEHIRTHAGIARQLLYSPKL
ncbi:hypothetical protein ACHQM5_011023 [Ranunculus cassubicifolius]